MVGLLGDTKPILLQLYNKKMINKNNICVIVGCYPQNNIDSALVSLTIESFKRQGYDICLTSHSPVNNDIQQLCKYYIYSDENYKLQFPYPSSIGSFFANNEIHYQTNRNNQVGSHSYSILMNMKNAFWLLKNKIYKKFIYIEIDTFINDNDHQILESMLEKADFENKDFWFMLENKSNNYYVPSTSIFGGDIHFFNDKLSEITSPEIYLDKCSLINGFSLEALFNYLFLNEEHNGFIEHKQPREIFKSEWLGISSLGNISIPGLKSSFNVTTDIVKLKHNNDTKSIVFMLEGNLQNENITVKLYKNNSLLDNINLNTGSYLWWIYNSYSNDDIWKIEIFYKDKIINLLERTTQEIFWNYWSYFEIKN